MLTVNLIKVSIVFAIAFSVGEFTMAEDKPDSTVKKSPLVSLGDGDYCLSGTNTNDLVLTHEKKTNWERWSVAPEPFHEVPVFTGLPREASWPASDSSHKVSAIALARMKYGSLLAVIKTTNDGKAYFWAMKISQINEVGENVDKLRPAAVLLATGDPRQRILAVSGDIDPPAFTVVTGIISEVKAGQIEYGSISFEWCGSLEESFTGRFTPEYPENKAN